MEKLDIGHDPAALHEAVPRGELGEDVEPLHDFCRKRPEIPAVDSPRLAAQLVPAGDQVVDLTQGALLVIMQRPRRRDGQVFVEELSQMIDLRIDRGAFTVGAGGLAPHHLFVHLGKIEARGAAVIDCHQRPVVDFDDKATGGLKHVKAIPAQCRDQQNHRDKGAEDGRADRGCEAYPPGVTAS